MTCDTCGRQVRVQLLGRFSVSVGDEMLIDDGWPRRKAAAVLKLLALQPGRAMHRDRIADALWPELDGDAAASNLRKNVHRLRSRLPGSMSDVVRRSGALVELHPDVWIDVVAFREAAEAALADGAKAALDAALALYAGDLLEADSHEPWAETLREGLRSLHLRVLLASAERHERDGAPEIALRRFQAAAAIDPQREESHRGVMRALNALGNPVGALRHYEATRAELAIQIGVAPAKETQISPGRSSSDRLLMSLRRCRRSSTPPAPMVAASPLRPPARAQRSCAPVRFRAATCSCAEATRRFARPYKRSKNAISSSSTTGVAPDCRSAPHETSRWRLASLISRPSSTLCGATGLPSGVDGPAARRRSPTRPPTLSV